MPMKLKFTMSGSITGLKLKSTHPTNGNKANLFTILYRPQLCVYEDSPSERKSAYSYTPMSEQVDFSQVVFLF